MNSLRIARESRNLSQRELARRAGISFKGLQLIEAAGHDPRLSTLEKIAQALGLPASGLRHAINHMFGEPTASLFCASLRILQDGFDSWKGHLFDFVDAFRAKGIPELASTAPVAELDARLHALLASTAEQLSDEQGRAPPDWTASVRAVGQPWFVSGVESLKASALLESPVRFRSRNVFVLANFLARA